MVDYPLHNLSLKDETGKEQLYELYALSEHYGDTFGGHYMAKVKDPFDNKWYLYNDSQVSEIPAAEAVSKYAYVLYYRK